MTRLSTHFFSKENFKRNWGKYLFYGCLIALPLAQFLIMYIYVNINSLVMCFRSYNIETDAWSWVGFSNFESLFNDMKNEPVFAYAFKNSAMLKLITIAIGSTLSITFSYYIYKKRFAWKIFRVLLFLPSILSGIVTMTMYRYFVDFFLRDVIQEATGNSQFLGFISDQKYALGAIIVFNLLMGFGTTVLMYTGKMTQIDGSIIEAADIDGAGSVRQFFSIVFPQIIPYVSIFVYTAIAGTFTDQMNLYTIYNHQAIPKLQTIGYYLYRGVQRATSYAVYPKLAALGIIVTLITAPMVMLVRYLFKKFDPMEG